MHFKIENLQNYLRKVKCEYKSDQHLKNQRKRKYYDIFLTRQFLFTKFPPSSPDDLIDFLADEKLTDDIKNWHLYSRTMSQNGKSGKVSLSYDLSLNNSTDKNVFGQFGWFSRIGSHMEFK